jgi:hypothetical protein
MATKIWFKISKCDTCWISEVKLLTGDTAGSVLLHFQFQQKLIHFLLFLQREHAMTLFL